jgi:hypothetical protein
VGVFVADGLTGGGDEAAEKSSFVCEPGAGAMGDMGVRHEREGDPSSLHLPEAWVGSGMSVVTTGGGAEVPLLRVTWEVAWEAGGQPGRGRNDGWLGRRWRSSG